MILNIMDNINEIAEKIKQFIIDNQTNPILWITLFLGGLAIAMWTFKKLNKDS